jgi:hypothetical protein
MHPILRLSVPMLLAASCLSFAPHPRPDSELILGTWVSEKDKNWKLVFTKDKCTQYYSGEAPEVDHYTLSNKSPQCGEKVPVVNSTTEYHYLQLLELKNNETTCYELNGLTAKVLSLRPIHTGGALVFIRKN